MTNPYETWMGAVTGLWLLALIGMGAALLVVRVWLWAKDHGDRKAFALQRRASAERVRRQRQANREKETT